MINIVLALKKRLERFIMAESVLTEACSPGDNTIKIRTTDSMFFDIVNHYKSKPRIVIYNPNSSTSYDSYHSLTAVDRSTGTLSVFPDLADSFDEGCRVKRCPGQQIFNRILIGDVSQKYELPAIVISPSHQSRKWVTLPTGSDEKFEINISVCIQDQGNEEAELSLLSAVQEIDDLLMADLHLRVPSGPNDQSDRVYNSLVSDIDYGYIQRDTAFIKAATLSWFADQYIIRLVARDAVDFDYFNYYPGDQFGPGAQGFETEDQNRIDGIYTDLND